MLHLNVGFLWGLRNQDFPEVITEICSIHDVDQIEELYVKESLERLKARDKELDFVMEMRNPHPLTEVLDKDCKDRRDNLVGLRRRIEGILKSPIKEERDSAKVLYLWLNKHRQYIYSLSIITQNRLVANLQTELATKEPISNALSSLGLVSVFDSIVALTTKIKRNTASRHTDNSAAKKKATVLRNAAYSDLVKFIKAYETALNLESPDTTFYADYGREISSRLDTYRSRYIARRTRMSNNATKQDQPEEEIDNGEHPIVNARSAKPKPFTLRAMNGLKVDVAAMNGNAIQKEAEHEKPTNGGVVHDIPATSEIVDV